MAQGVPKPVLGVTSEQTRDRDLGVAAARLFGERMLMMLCELVSERTLGVELGGVRMEKHLGVDSTAGVMPRGVAATAGLVKRSSPKPGSFGLEVLPEPDAH